MSSHHRSEKEPPKKEVNVLIGSKDNDVTSILWTHAELCLGIVGACLPCYRPLFKNLENIFGSNQKSTSASQPRSKIPTDAYKSLDGKETSMDGSKIKLVPSDQWSGKSAPTSQVPGTLKSQATVNGRSRERDVESGLSPHVINVTHAIDVSTTPR